MNRYIVRTQARKWTYNFDVLRVLVSRDFKLRYKRSILGIAWSLMVPLAQLGVFYVVFKYMIPLSIPHYTTFLFSGILPWAWLQQSLVSAALSVVDNGELVKQAGFPVALLPVVTVISQLLHFLLALPVLAGFMIAEGYRLTPVLLAFPIVILVEFILIQSLAYFVAAMQVTFRDTQYLLTIVLFLFFYLTPVFWDTGSVAEPFRSMMQLNPLAVLLNSYRAILVGRHWPDFGALLIVAVGSTLTLALGHAVFSSARDRFVEEI